MRSARIAAAAIVLALMVTGCGGEDRKLDQAKYECQTTSAALNDVMGLDSDPAETCERVLLEMGRDAFVERYGD